MKVWAGEHWRQLVQCRCFSVAASFIQDSQRLFQRLEVEIKVGDIFFFSERADMTWFQLDPRHSLIFVRRKFNCSWPAWKTPSAGLDCKGKFTPGTETTPVWQRVRQLLRSKQLRVWTTAQRFPTSDIAAFTLQFNMRENMDAWGKFGRDSQ